MSKKILVLGKSGQLGQEVIRIFSDGKYDVCAPDEKEADVSVFQKLEKVVSDFNPDVIINCAAYTNVDACENESGLASLVNTFGTENCAKVALRSNAFLIHISTDYVYDGKTRFQKVSHKTNFRNEQPLNVYGITKLYGEGLIHDAMSEIAPYNYVILRTSGLYGRFGNNFLSRMKKMIMENLNNDTMFRLVSDQWYCPTSALQLARQIKIWVDLSEEDRTYIMNRDGNVFNANNLGFTSPYLFFSQYCVFADYYGFFEHIKPIRFSDYFNGRKTANRPKSVVLKNELAEKYGKELNAFTTIEEALEEYVNLQCL